MARIPEIPGYVIEKDLGEGGMARVYLAREEKLDRLVALKVLRRALTEEENLTARFLKEARTAAGLRHSHIVSIFDVGQLGDEIYYFAMEYLEESLKDRIQAGTLQPETALRVFSQLASALDYAHGEGLIHRDIKPENIMFRGDGAVVLCDFGIARAVGSATRLTKTGMSVGTPHYMSPEQARGKPLDGRSDLYSLGVVLYEMLTGKVPFEAEDSVAVAIAHVQDPVPRLPDYLSKYQPLLDKLLAKDPGQRPQTGKEAADLAKNLPSAGPDDLNVVESAPVEPAASQTPLPGRPTRRVEEPDFPEEASPGVAPSSTPFSESGRQSDQEPRRVKPAWLLVGALVVLLGILGIKLATDASSRAEQAAWQQAQSANTVSAYGGYLREYPQGEYAARARSWQKSLRDTEEASRRRQQAAEKSKREQEATYAGYLQTAKKRVSSGDDAGALRAVNAALQLRDSAELRTLKGEIELRLAAAARAREEAERERQAQQQAERERLAREKAEAERLAQEQAEKERLARERAAALGFEWAKVEAGEFSMGSNEGESDEKPVHRVYLDTYYISKFEVTVGQFRTFVTATGYRTDAEKGNGGYVWDGRKWVEKPDANWKNPYFQQSDESAVVLLSWNDAMAFCTWLSSQTGKTVRLPTEAEWEKAAKGGNNSRGYTYSGSNNVDAVAWYFDNSGRKTHPVGQKSANELGILDMSGNVWEWCADWYDKDYYSRSPARNPTGPSSGSYRVVRGGSWISNASFCRSADRGGFHPSFRDRFLGFRPVMEP